MVWVERKGKWLHLYCKWFFCLLVPVDSRGQFQTRLFSFQWILTQTSKVHNRFTATWEQLFAVLIFASLVNLHADPLVCVGVFNLQSPCRSVRAFVLNEISVSIPPSIQQVVFRMTHKIYDALHLQTDIRSELNECKRYCVPTFVCRYSTHHFVMTAGEDALWKVQTQKDAGHSPHIYSIGEGEAQHDFWSSEKRKRDKTYLISKGKSEKHTNKPKKPPNNTWEKDTCILVPAAPSRSWPRSGSALNQSQLFLSSCLQYLLTWCCQVSNQCGWF